MAEISSPKQKSEIAKSYLGDSFHVHDLTNLIPTYPCGHMIIAIRHLMGLLLVALVLTRHVTAALQLTPLPVATIFHDHDLHFQITDSPPSYIQLLFWVFGLHCIPKKCPGFGLW